MSRLSQIVRSRAMGLVDLTPPRAPVSRVADDLGARSPAELAYLRAVLAASAITAELLYAMEDVAERLAPERSAVLAATIAERFATALADGAAALAAAPAPTELAPFDRLFAAGFEHARACATLFGEFPSAPPPERIPRILTSLHHHAQAQEHLYPLRALLPALRDYWSPDHAPAAAGGAPARPALVRMSAGGHHGGFAVYVPEEYDGTTPWPVIVALHGGSGNGRDFLWTWVRDAKRAGYLVVAPTAVGSTWGEVDELGLLEMLSWLRGRYAVAADRVLLTGLSDGGTFTLVYGLAHTDVFRALAPCCGVFHPINFANGNLDRARGTPIYLVHGAQDFLFPVQLAHIARDTLTAAGAHLTYRELPELSHTYPRSENAAILDWFASLP
jgi:phospholipase/carboxylesterase